MTTDDLAPLFRRDLIRLGQQVEAFPTDEMLWRTPAQFTNPPGNLVLHIEGNLREYVGRQLGNTPYVRNRPLEFSTRGVSKRDLVSPAPAATRGGGRPAFCDVTPPYD